MNATIEQPARRPHDVLEGEPANLPTPFALVAFALALGAIFGLLWVLLLRGASGGGYRGGGPVLDDPELPHRRPCPPVGGSGGSREAHLCDGCHYNAPSGACTFGDPSPGRPCPEFRKCTPERSYCLLCRREVRTETGQVCDLCMLHAGEWV